MESVTWENGNIRRTARKRVYRSDSESNSKESYDALNLKPGRHKKIPRRSATVAANKLRLMSDVEEELSSSGSGGIGSKNRKLPHRNASAAARKLLLDASEDDIGLKYDSEKEPNEKYNRKKPSEAVPAAARRKHISESESSDSESDTKTAQKSRHSNSYKQGHKTARGSYPKMKKPMAECSEEDSKSVKSEGECSQKASSQSVSAHKDNVTSNSESEAGSEKSKCSGKVKKWTCQKAAMPFRKAKVLSESEDTESETEYRGDESSALSETRKPRTSGSSKVGLHAGFSCSNLESEVDSSSSNHFVAAKTKKRKRKRKAIGKGCASQDSGHSRRTTRKRTHGTDSVKSEEVYKITNTEVHGCRRIPRRSATLAANKLRLMSDVEEELSSLGSGSIGSKNRKLPHRNASAAARKLLLDASEDDIGLQSESEIEPNEKHNRKKLAEAVPATARRRHISESKNASSDSEKETKVEQKNRHSHCHKRAHKTTHSASPKMKKPTADVSEEDSKSNKLEGESSQKASSQSTSAHKDNVASNSESEAGPESNQYNGKIEKINHKRAATVVRKARALKDITESEMEDRGNERSSVLESRELSETPRSLKGESDAGFNAPSNLESETDSVNSNHSKTTKTKKRKRKGKRSVIRKESAPEEIGQSTKQLRSRTRVNNYTNYVQLTNETRTAKALAGRKSPRKSAAVAANKIKIISDAKEELSSSESICSGNKNRKLPHRNASAVARRMLLTGSGEDAGLQSESEELNEQYTSKKKHFQAGSSAARRKYICESKRKMEVTHTSKNSNGHKQPCRTVCSASPRRKKPTVDSSEEDSKSHKSPDESNRKVSHISASAHNHNALCSTELEEESESGKCSGKIIKVDHQKAATPSKKTKALKDVKDRTGSETEVRENGRCTLLKSKKPGTSGSSKPEPEASFNCSSNLESETDSNNSNTSSATNKKRKRKAIQKGQISNTNLCKPPRRLQRRKRLKVNEDNDFEELNYAKYKRANRRSKIRTRNRGKRTVRYDDDGDDDDRGADIEHGT
uniref:Uncharacterized protein n=1 Tax=Sphenodon punctatus TaxID=8508 RepID=A0A8D0L7U9_SPHPU